MTTDSQEYKSEEKPGRLYLRTQQTYKLARDKNVWIIAPEWVKDALAMLSPLLQHRQFLLCQEGTKKTNNQPIKVGEFTLGNELTLLDVHKLIQSDTENTNGVIDFTKFPGIPEAVIFSLIDLVYHSVIACREKATQQGGYSGSPIKKFAKPKTFYIGHCSYPQFQQDYNTGRAYLLDDKENLRLGLLDDYIALAETKSLKPTLPLEKLQSDPRFLPVKLENTAYFFDTKNYCNRIMNMFIQYALTENTLAEHYNETLNLKFLNGGTGCFIEGLYFLDGRNSRAVMTEYLLTGIRDGLTSLFRNYPDLDRIKSIELPFFIDPENERISSLISEIESLCQKNGKNLVASKRDALEPSSEELSTLEKFFSSKLNMADSLTTNGDAQTAAGNEGLCKDGTADSIEPMIIFALTQKGDNLSPHLNPDMQVKYLPSHRPMLESRIPFEENLTESKKGDSDIYSSTDAHFPAVTIRYKPDQGLVFKFENQKECNHFLKKVGQGTIPQQFRTGKQFDKNPTGKTPYQDPDHPARLITPSYISNGRLACNFGDERIVKNFLHNSLPRSTTPEEISQLVSNQIEKIYYGTWIIFSAMTAEKLEPQFEAQKSAIYLSKTATKILGEKNKGGLEGSIEISVNGIAMMKNPAHFLEEINQLRLKTTLEMDIKTMDQEKKSDEPLTEEKKKKVDAPSSVSEPVEKERKKSEDRVELQDSLTNSSTSSSISASSTDMADLPSYTSSSSSSSSSSSVPLSSAEAQPLSESIVPSVPYSSSSRFLKSTDNNHQEITPEENSEKNEPIFR